MFDSVRDTTCLEKRPDFWTKNFSMVPTVPQAGVGVGEGTQVCFSIPAHTLPVVSTHTTHPTIFFISDFEQKYKYLSFPFLATVIQIFIKPYPATRVTRWDPCCHRTRGRRLRSCRGWHVCSSSTASWSRASVWTAGALGPRFGPRGGSGSRWHAVCKVSFTYI